MEEGSGGVLTVYVSRRDSPLRLTIARGSGIVGSPTGDENVVVDYEGNVYGSANLRTFADRVQQAAGCHRRQYPTVARQVVPQEQFVPVGVWDGDAVELTVTPALLLEWIGPVASIEAELRPST